MKKRVVVAMSGGVDSAVAAFLLTKEGYEVIGVTMQLWPKNEALLESTKQRGCCSIDAVNDAFSVAAAIGIPHYTINVQKEFENSVIRNFKEEYLAGRTPNPCIRCNEFIKFDLLLKKALAMGGDYLATGHYARIRQCAEGCYQLLRGIDHSKDQSYVLHTLTQEQLSRILFPLGNYTKENIRSLAKQHNIAVADKQDSQDICFVAGKDYTKVITDGAKTEQNSSGPIYDKEGKLLGFHRGLAHYTVGQRRGLGVSSSNPIYVIALETERNALIVGEKSDLYRDSLLAENVNWVSILPQSTPYEALIKIRYQAPLMQGVFFLDGSKVIVKFKEPQIAITPGQAVVFYDGDILLGGGTIAG